MANYLSRCHDLSLIVSESKEKSVIQDDIIVNHFKSLDDEQKFFFGKQTWPTTSELITVGRGKINSEEIRKRIIEKKVEGIAVFGSGILKKNIFSTCPGNVINSHQGLSPYYRGSATNFWPFVNRELQYVGLTMHYIDEGIDTGQIICHGFPNIEIDDNMHSIGCKVIQETAKFFDIIFKMIENGNRPIGVKQWAKGKLYQRKDFNSKAIIRANNNIDNGLIKNFVRKGKNAVLSFKSIKLS